MKIRLMILTLALIMTTSVILLNVDGKERSVLGVATADAADQAVIAIDGSSTVFPITEAVAEEFQKGNKARVTVGISGTGGGFKKFCKGETAISDASRPISPKEVEACSAGNIEYIELPIAYDGISVVVNPANTWVDHLTTAELKKIWAPEAQGKVTKWSQVRQNWPEVDLKLFGPGVDSGTFDYFTEAVVGTAKSSRGDFTASEDDNVLVQGVAGAKGGIGFFGVAYYAENAKKLKLVPVDNGKGPISPTDETIMKGAYAPLSRPIFIYVNKKAAATRPEVDAFVKFYLANAAKLVREVKYVSLPQSAMDLVSARYAKKTTGSAFKTHNVGITIEELLKSEK
jgi:phosphate transport system substrate-binding protein